VLELPLDRERGTLGPGATLLEMQTPDNIEQDADGRLWIASPVRNEVLVVDPDTWDFHVAFRSRSAARSALAEEWARPMARST
jgi:hypothetical protein